MKAWTVVRSAVKIALGATVKFFADTSDDLLAGFGIAMVSRGVYLIYPPAAYIVGGTALIIVGLLRATRAAARASVPDNN